MVDDLKGIYVARQLSEIQSLEQIKELMTAHDVVRMVYKRLAPNDNSKNQIYLGGDYSSIQLLPFGSISTDQSRIDSKRDRFKADLPFYWMDEQGYLFLAPNAQLILYPKYPEVRMSGFLLGAEFAPSQYLASRDEGRVLILGITGDKRIIGHVIGHDNPMSKQLLEFDNEDVLCEVPNVQNGQNEKSRLLDDLKVIHEMSWVNSFRLDRDGNMMPYKAPNGGGYTLEGLLGIIPNGRNEPDYLGWEVKQHKTAKLDKPLSGGPITLMTPEPTGGFYRSDGVIEFVKVFGYPDVSGIEDRYNFGGVHRFDELCARTNLTLKLIGFDPDKKKITDVNGGITLVAENGVHAAIWHFSTLLEKWARKHAKAVYVPALSRKADNTQYWYGNVVALGTGTDFVKFLSAMAAKTVYYDPGIKVENISTAKPKAKRRSQFRIRGKDISSLYDEFEIVNLNEI